MTARLRHIALSVRDVERAQKFFEDAFGMEKAGEAGHGVYMTDGAINIALLDRKGRADRKAGSDLRAELDDLRERTK